MSDKTNTDTSEISADDAVSSAKPSITEPEPAFGWTAYAEQVNGRFAMVGIVLLLVLEFFTHQDFFSWLGLR